MGRKPAAVQPEQTSRAKAGGTGGSRRDEDGSAPGPSGSGSQLTGQPSPGERSEWGDDKQHGIIKEQFSREKVLSLEKNDFSEKG